MFCNVSTTTSKQQTRVLESFPTQYVPLKGSIWIESRMPPSAKTFNACKSRPGPLSTNKETAWTREICQSRTGWDVAQERIKTKYRTRRSWAKAALQKRSGWSELSSVERSEKENSILEELAIQEEEELDATAKEWVEMVYGEEWVKWKEEEGVEGEGSEDATQEIVSTSPMHSDNEE